MDLIVLTGAFILIAGWLVFTHSGERGRIARCAGNLNVLGQAMQSDANDHDGGIPPAAISLDQTRINWAVDLLPYLNPSHAPVRSVYDRSRLLEHVSRRFVCPSDPGERGKNPCSYAMSERDMTFGWPPAPDDKTGLGLWWDKNTTLALLGSSVAQSAGQRPELLPRLKLSILPAPADTLLLTDFIARNNTMEFISSTRVRTVQAQREIYKGDSSRFHLGGFNYLMADGHVEWLVGLQTGSIENTPGGIWTIKAGD